LVDGEVARHARRVNHLRVEGDELAQPLVAELRLLLPHTPRRSLAFRARQPLDPRQPEGRQVRRKRLRLRQRAVRPARAPLEGHQERARDGRGVVARDVLAGEERPGRDRPPPPQALARALEPLLVVPFQERGDQGDKLVGRAGDLRLVVVDEERQVARRSRRPQHRLDRRAALAELGEAVPLAERATPHAHQDHAPGGLQAAGRAGDEERVAQAVPAGVMGQGGRKGGHRGDRCPPQVMAAQQRGKPGLAARRIGVGVQFVRGVDGEPRVGRQAACDHKPVPGRPAEAVVAPDEARRLRRALEQGHRQVRLHLRIDHAGGAEAADERRTQLAGIAERLSGQAQVEAFAAGRYGAHVETALAVCLKCAGRRLTLGHLLGIDVGDEVADGCACDDLGAARRAVECKQPQPAVGSLVGPRRQGGLS